MQSHSTSRLTDERIKEIRSLRRAGIRRRRILVAVLVLASLVVLGLSFALHYSALWTLIPFVMLVAVLALGVRAGRYAKAWEAGVARARVEERERRARAASITVGRQDVTPTRTMSKEELKQLLRQRAAEQRTRAEQAGRGNAEQEKGQTAQPSGTSTQAGSASVSAVPASVASASPASLGASAVSSRSAAESEGRAAAGAVPPAREGADQAKGELVASQIPESASDARNAMGDLGDMGRASGQDPLRADADDAPLGEVVGSVPDLISFSLGQERNGTVAEEPQSAPIKSVRQVAVAVERDHVEPPAESKVDGVPVSALRSPGERDADALHEGRDRAEDSFEGRSVPAGQPVRSGKESVDAPAGSADSLGVDVDSVMARRRG